MSSGWQLRWCRDWPKAARTGCRESDIMTCPPHTTGLGALVADLVVPQIDVRDGRICLQRLAQGLEAATDQGWRLVRGLYPQNQITEIPRTINIQLRHVEFLSDLKPEKTIQTSTLPFRIYIQLGLGVFCNSTRIRYERWLQHLQTIQNSHCHRMSGKWHHDMPRPTTHQALAPSSSIWFLRKSMFVADLFIFSASAKAWRQRQIKAGIWFGFTVKTWSLKSHEQLTFNWDNVESLWF